LQATNKSTSSLLSIIAPDMQQVDRVIAQRLDSGVPLVGEVSRYIISAGGKRLRPALLLLVCGALRYAGQRNTSTWRRWLSSFILPLCYMTTWWTRRRCGAAMPLPMKPSATRRVCWLGIFLYSRAFQMMVDADSMRIMQVLADATNIIAEGEVMQLMNMHNAGLDEAGYLQVIRSKTAKLFEASARVGAILSDASPDLECACADYGQAMGNGISGD
jgi:octaprenyl-diphosphate synthase